MELLRRDAVERQADCRADVLAHSVRDMTADQVILMFSVLDLRELLIAKLGVLAGMRPGEIFALDWSSLEQEYANIRQGVYRGHIDTPKTHRSIRRAALAEGLRQTIELWRTASGNPPPTAWVFPPKRGRRR